MVSPVSDNRLVNAQNCTQESVREGLRSAAIACFLTTVPTRPRETISMAQILTIRMLTTNFTVYLSFDLAAVKMIPWAKANLNYTGQALIISGASIASYFIAADKTILKAAKKNARYERKA